MHLFLFGDSGVGKSTVLRTALAQRRIVPAGFHTRKIGVAVYLCPAASACYDTSHQIATVHAAQSCTDTAKFAQLGTQYLSHIPAGALVLMDELGRLEQAVPAFQKQVLSVLDGPYTVLGVIKQANAGSDAPWLAQVRRHPKVRLLSVTAENREAVLRDVLQFLDRKCI